MGVRLKKISKKKVAAVVTPVVLVILVCIAVPLIAYRLGQHTTLWGHFYLGNTPAALIIETDYEDGHPVNRQIMLDVLDEMREVCDRDVLWFEDLTDEVDLPQDFLDVDTRMVDHTLLNSLRDTMETWDTIYIIFSDNEYDLGQNMYVGGLFSAPGCIVIMQTPQEQGLEYYTLIHEIGHCFGLGHYDEGYMVSTLNPENLPTGWGEEAMSDLHKIRGYVYYGNSGVMLWDEILEIRLFQLAWLG